MAQAVSMGVIYQAWNPYFVREVQMTLSSNCPKSPACPDLFVSYCNDDDRPPTNCPERPGFVTYLCNDIADLLQEELGEKALFIDKAIPEAYNIVDRINFALETTKVFLVMLSASYVKSVWCAFESERIMNLIERGGTPLLLIVERSEVRREILEQALRGMDPRIIVEEKKFKFYEKDGSDVIRYFTRGKVSNQKGYEHALYRLVRRIVSHITDELNNDSIDEMREKQNSRTLKLKISLPKNNRNVFLAAPAIDMKEQCRLTREELEQRGFTVLPRGELPQDDQHFREAVSEALRQCEFSIHLVGCRRGIVPDGGEPGQGIVPMQLMLAREEATRRQDFYRIIWAPKNLPGVDPGSGHTVSIDDFDPFYKTDEVLCGDYAALREFFLLRLQNTMRLTQRRRRILVGAFPEDQANAETLLKHFSELGATCYPWEIDLASTAEKLPAALNNVDHMVLCWATADYRDVLKLANAVEEINSSRLGGRDRFALVVAGHINRDKQVVLRAGCGSSTVVDGVSGLGMAAAKFLAAIGIHTQAEDE